MTSEYYWGQWGYKASRAIGRLSAVLIEDGIPVYPEGG